MISEPNQSIEPTGGSRFCLSAFVSHWRLPSVAHANVSLLIAMKHCLLSFVLCGLALHSALAATNLLSIHFVADKVLPQSEPGTMPAPGSLNLISPPVLADADFVSFDLTNQTFTITADAARRLEAKVKNGPPTLLRDGFFELIPYPTACVVTALGEPVYVGAFWTGFSSSSFFGPVMLPNEAFISMRSTNQVTFRIELGYPGTFPGTPDPRRDSRIVSAVQKLFSHPKK